MKQKLFQELSMQDWIPLALFLCLQKRESLRKQRQVLICLHFKIILITLAIEIFYICSILGILQESKESNSHRFIQALSFTKKLGRDENSLIFNKLSKHGIVGKWILSGASLYTFSLKRKKWSLILKIFLLISSCNVFW